MPRFLRRPAFWVILAVLLLGGVGAVMFSGQQKAQKAKAAEAAKASSDTPFAAIANGKADVEGGVIPVAARAAAVVREVLVQEGESVVKGQILARQEDDAPRLAAATANADLMKARADIAATNGRILTAKREYARMEKLKAANFAAGQQLDRLNDDIIGAEASLQAQQAAVAAAQARLSQSEFNRELTVIRAPADGVIVRRYANPGAGASTLNVSTMFDLEPKTARIVRAEIGEASVPSVFIGQAVELSPEGDGSKVYVGKVIRRAAMFGARKLQSDDPTERTDDRVVEVVVSADGAPFLIGQRVLVKFLKPGQTAGAKRVAATTTAPAK
ncbi:MAG: hemolysin secretion protein D [Caulobacterales bacterium 68-7]|nr:MAG: hemolysin secretion protein D [Caulobacterales bacterium 68-7]